MPRPGECPWCRKPVGPRDLNCPACGFKLREPPKPQAGRTLDVQPVRGPAERLTAFVRSHRGPVFGVGLPAVGVLVALASWHVYTLPVRAELRRVEAQLDALPQLEQVRVEVPSFRRTMPPTVPVTAVGLPGGYASEVHIPLEGVYDTQARKARLRGGTYVILANTRVELNWEFEVPPEGP